MFRPSRSSSGPPRRQTQELSSFTALWDPKCLQVLLQEHILHKLLYTEWPKEMCTLFTHQYLWNKFK